MKISIDYDIRNKSAVIYLEGEADVTVSRAFKDILVELDRRVEYLSLDFTKVKYFGLSSVRSITMLHRKFKDKLKIINPSGKALDVLKKTGISEVIPIEYQEYNEKNFMSHSVDYNNTDFKKIISEKLKIYPDEVFMIYRNQEYNWRRIEVISQIIANDLSKLGVKQNDFVGLSSINSANLICAIFAIQKLGAVCVMINPSYKASEIKELSNTADFNYLCYGDLDVDNAEETLKETGIKNIYNISSDIDFYQRKDEYEEIKHNFDDIETNYDDPAIMIFTSGSTGTPKGALHSFSTLSISALSIELQEYVTSKDKFCSTLPLFHIAGFTLDFMTALITGATLCIPDIRFGARLKEKTKAIVDTISKYKCSILNGVPAVVLYTYKIDDFKVEDVSSIKNVMVCAQPITQNQMDELISFFPNARIHNLYGMTENIPISIVSSDEPYDKLISSVGKPGRYTEVRIFDKDLHKECSIGQVGEIEVSGYDSIGCYYKKNESVQPYNDEGFIETGDLGFFDEDGYLHIVGRIKDIIIRGGENIVPREIENAMAKLDCIYDVHVCGIPDGPMGERVAAGVILNPGYVLDNELIKKELEKELAVNKIPKVIKVYDAFPLLANGKLDKIKFRKDLEEYHSLNKN